MCCTWHSKQQKWGTNLKERASPKVSKRLVAEWGNRSKVFWWPCCATCALSCSLPSSLPHLCQFAVLPWASEFTASGRAASEGLIVQLPVTQNNTWGSDEQPRALIQCQPSGCLNPPVKRRVPVATSVSLTRKTVHVIYVFSIWFSVSGDGMHALEEGKELNSDLESRKEPNKLRFQTVICWNSNLSPSSPEPCFVTPFLPPSRPRGSSHQTQLYLFGWCC